MSLTDAQKKLASGMLFPSGEANYYDFSQDHSYHSGSGINIKYTPTSGELYETYPPNSSGIAERSGVFSYVNLISKFSSGSGNLPIDDFSLYNDYIHYYNKNEPTSKNIKKNLEFRVPFVSSFKASVVFDPYKRIF